MFLSALFQKVDCEILGPDENIASICYDSRNATPGSLFVAVRGYKYDGHDFVGDAIFRGAKGIVVEELIDDVEVTQVVVGNTREALGRISAEFYGSPSRAMRVIGVTGTNGKTTTTYFIKSVLEKAGFKVGLIGTIQNLIGSEIIPAKRTTPESLDLQALLGRMRAFGVDYVVMEVSSHALELQRTIGLEYDVAVFTNLTQDHMDFHQSFEEYFNAKAKLFIDLAKESSKPNKSAVINYDDHYGEMMAAKSSAPIFSYGVDKPAQVRAEDVEVTSGGVAFRLVSPFGQAQLALNLTGKFNVYNSLAAAAACLSEGISLSDVKEGLESIPGVAGRFELVKAGQEFAVIVDYAHTPDSLGNVLRTARGFAKARLITVFGAGGDRDKGKRPLMGEVAADLSDVVLVTSDNPRSEDPRMICEEIEKGIERSENRDLQYELIVNRSEAIRRAIFLAAKDDIVIIAGKGHETYQEFKDGTIHFDDREEAISALEELRG